jgi:hypothetical protein
MIGRLYAKLGDRDGNFHEHPGPPFDARIRAQISRCAT